MSQPETPRSALSEGSERGENRVGGSSLAPAAARSTLWSLIGQVLQTLLGFGIAVLLTVWLRPEDYGVFGMASTVVVFLGIFGDGAVGQALVRRSKLGAAEETTAFAITLLGGLALAVLSLVAAPCLGLYFRSREVGVMAAVLATHFLILAPGRVSSAKLARGLKFRTVSVVGLVTTAIGGGVALIAARGGLEGWSLVLSFLAAPVAITCVYLALAPPKIEPRLFSRSVARELSAFSANLSGYAVAVCVAWLPWTLLLGRVTDAAAVGLFGMGSRIVVTSTGKIGAAFSVVFFPNIAKMTFAERERAYLTTLRMLVMCTAPVALGCVAIADELVTVLPSRWSGLAPVITGLAIGAVVEPLAMLSTSLLVTNERPGAVLRIGLFTIPIVWIGASLAAWSGRLSSFVVAWSAINLVVATVSLTVPLSDVRGAIKILRALGRPIVAATIMSVGVELFQRFTGTANRRIGIPVGICAGIVLYPPLVRVLMKDDMTRVARLLGSALNRLRR